MKTKQDLINWLNRIQRNGYNSENFDIFIQVYK